VSGQQISGEFTSVDDFLVEMPGGVVVFDYQAYVGEVMAAEVRRQAREAHNRAAVAWWRRALGKIP
jgi:hypothetical protein